MTRINPGCWFEIPVTDLERSKTFYEGVFAFTLTPEEMGPTKMLMFPSDKESAGITGALVKAEGCIPSTTGSTIYLEVKDLEKTLEKINQHGGTTLMPKMDIGEHGNIAQFLDCEGNRVALWSE